MVQFKKVSQPIVVKTEQVGELKGYYVEQEFNVEGFNFTVKHKCIARNDGSISISDYDGDIDKSLNEDMEKELCSHFNTGTAFEIYELMTMEAETEVKKIF